MLWMISRDCASFFWIKHRNILPKSYKTRARKWDRFVVTGLLVIIRIMIQSFFFASTQQTWILEIRSSEGNLRGKSCADWEDWTFDDECLRQSQLIFFYLAVSIPFQASQHSITILYFQIGESTYHCKIELEVDNPGCTEIIERSAFSHHLVVSLPFCFRIYDLRITFFMLFPYRIFPYSISDFCESRRVRPSSSHMNNCQMQFEPIDGPGPVLDDFDFGFSNRGSRPLSKIISLHFTITSHFPLPLLPLLCT